MNRIRQTQLYTDTRISRVIAALVAALMIIFLLTRWNALLWLLLADFTLRACSFRVSPLIVLARVIVNWVGLPPLLTFAPPKKIVAFLGYSGTLSVLVLSYTGYIQAATIVGVSLVTFAVLEAAFNVCVGCYIHSWVIAPIINRRMR